MSKQLTYATVTVEIAFDEEGNKFEVKGAVSGNGASKLSNLAASAISGAIIPVVHDVTSKVAGIYGEVGDDIYNYIQKEIDAQDEQESKAKKNEKV
ncbi:hypothetical protein DR996_02625 [Vibrio owensii]|nr:hypothetical protein DR996_02625 [Vibrio owensii]